MRCHAGVLSHDYWRHPICTFFLQNVRRQTARSGRRFIIIKVEINPSIFKQNKFYHVLKKMVSSVLLFSKTAPFYNYPPPSHICCAHTRNLFFYLAHISVMI